MKTIADGNDEVCCYVKFMNIALLQDWFVEGLPLTDIHDPPHKQQSWFVRRDRDIVVTGMVDLKRFDIL